MTQFKKMKMRINNPEHSKAVQEWLFEQGYYWAYGRVEAVARQVRSKYLYVGTSDSGQIGWSNSDSYFRENPIEEINVQHLDPLLYSVHKSSCTPSRTYKEKPKMKCEFEKLSEQLKYLDKAIESHENKQSKRKLDRERIVEKMNGMLPKGYVMVKGDDEENNATFDPEEIVEGSVWECIKKTSCGMTSDCTIGDKYKVLHVSEDSVEFSDDVNDIVDMFSKDFLEHFKRIS